MCVAQLLVMAAASLVMQADDVQADDSPPLAGGDDRGLPAFELTFETDDEHGLQRHSSVTFGPGPRGQGWSPENRAAEFGNSRAMLSVADRPALQIGPGESVTVEAWVQPTRPFTGSYAYVVGKGRSHGDATRTDNQNYALRLARESDGLHPSFLWSDRLAEGILENGHRWTATRPLPNDGGWHHLAVAYTFGTATTPDDVGPGAELLAWIDGQPVAGRWDMHGNTNAAPVVDDDALLVGNAMGGRGGNALPGRVDDIRITRGLLDEAVIRQRAAQRPEPPAAAIPFAEVDRTTAPHGVTVRLWHGLPKRPRLAARSLTDALDPERPAESFLWPELAMDRLPNFYTRRGVIDDRRGATLVHVACWATIPAGQREVLLRSLDEAALYIDGEPVAAARVNPYVSGSAHNTMYEPRNSSDRLLSRPAAHDDAIGEFPFDGQPHLFEVYRVLGPDDSHSRLGELVVATAAAGEPFEVVTATRGDDSLGEPGRELQSPPRFWPLLDEAWRTFRQRSRDNLKRVNDGARFAAAAEERRYWQRRHAYAREVVAQREKTFRHDSVDGFLDERLAAEGLTVTPPLDELSLLRRTTLDVVGRIPTQREIDRFLADPPSQRRRRALDRLLASPEWADHWVAYWQDVLAENPGLTKPKLGNSGPFRWFLYEAFRDNWAFDRFATTLLLMEGSPNRGGPAGFAMASENDVPLAAKAHIVGTAFLGLEMRCARCHDAPDHPFRQRDLFAMAAMLKRKPITVPKSSSVPIDPEHAAESLVKVTLPPGSVVPPEWTLADWSLAGRTETPPRQFPDWLLRGDDDSRERLAAMVTDPRNRRFAEVAVNRLFARYLGRGLVDSPDDWAAADVSHPELLAWLADEFIAHDYDLKHVSRLLLESDVYARSPVPGLTASSFAAAEFRGPIRRRMTAEQLLDSAHRAVGKRLRAEDQTHSIDNSQSVGVFLQMQRPGRAWELISAANERDRPSLALPQVQASNDLTRSFGRRDQRQDPTTQRSEVVTPLQPMALAHGSLSSRLIDLSDRGQLVDVALAADSPEALLTTLTRRLLTRDPTPQERERLLPLLRDGFDSRATGEPATVEPIHRRLVTWRNHFDPNADRLQTERMAALEAGESPSPRLEPTWRAACEDVVWTLLNTPEFVWVP